MIIEAKKAVSSGCQIRYRDAFRAAVFGFFAGGVSGGLYGAAGGTVLVPGVGTATGAVAGFFVGGADGFITGFIMSVAEQAFFNCMFNSPVTDPELSCEDFDFSLNNMEYCNIDQNAPSLRWYLMTD